MNIYISIIVHTYFQDICNFFLFFAQSDKYRLISVWYGTPDSSLCSLKKSIVSLSILIVICFFSFLTYGFRLPLLKSYSSFIFTPLSKIVILLRFTCGCFPCRNNADYRIRFPIAMTDYQKISRMAKS